MWMPVQVYSDQRLSFRNRVDYIKTAWKIRKSGPIPWIPHPIHLLRILVLGRTGRWADTPSALLSIAKNTIRDTPPNGKQH